VIAPWVNQPIWYCKSAIYRLGYRQQIRPIAKEERKIEQSGAGLRQPNQQRVQDFFPLFFTKRELALHHSDLVHSAYNPFFQFVFSAKTIFFSHNKSANSIFCWLISTAERLLVTHSHVAPRALGQHGWFSSSVEASSVVIGS
jgi:hypothetical protein